jgi:hypothetical protein
VEVVVADSEDLVVAAVHLAVAAQVAVGNIRKMCPFLDH